MYILPAFTSIHTPKTPLNMVFNREYFFFEQGLSIGLCQFAVIVTSEVLIISTTQMGGLGESPAQIAIAIFTVAMALAFAVR